MGWSAALALSAEVQADVVIGDSHSEWDELEEDEVELLSRMMQRCKEERDP